jgi:hypothetical protein
VIAGRSIGYRYRTGIACRNLDRNGERRAFTAVRRLEQSLSGV